jgi:hypothetical protein
VRAPVLPAAVAEAVGAGRGPLRSALARRLLEDACGIPFCREIAAATVDEAVAAAGRIGYPVVVKADAPGLSHKTEAGAVTLGLRDAMAVGDACRQMAARVGTTCFVVQEQVGPGVELLLGARRDPSFGPVVALGTGGVLAEVVRDVSFRLVPVAEEEIAEMFDEGLRPRLLAGPRGLPAVDRPALARALGALSDLMASEPRVLEIDVNPVIAVAAGLVAVDALVIVGEPP